MTVMVRFQQSQRYDISRDADVVLFMATTERGTYWTEQEMGTTGSMRTLKQEFKDAVVECIRKGEPPCELQFEEADG